MRTRQQKAAYAREYYHQHRTERLAHDREYYRKNRERILARQKRYYEQNKIKRAAKKKAWYYIPLGDKCEKCGSRENLERHHPDYTNPLEVQTLCRSCHALLHLGLKKEALT